MFGSSGGQAQDPVSAYSQLDPMQRQQVAQHFIQAFAGKNDPQSQQFARMDPNSVTPEQLAAMHQIARSVGVGAAPRSLRSRARPHYS
jgi:hypothetical protein